MEGWRRLRLDLAYDGTEFCGWQVQPGRRTVQGELERVLSRLAGERPVRVTGAGRTDAGAHARAQVAHADVPRGLDVERLARALRGMLPEDLRPLAVREVPFSFHARKSALEKTYRYRIDRSASGDPFLARYAWRVPGPLDREALAEALRALPGRKDFRGFASAACTVRDTRRELREARYEETDGARDAWFTFRADGFLTYMARNLVGTLIEVARGRIEPQRVARVLERGDRTLAGPTAPARGLVLWEVLYGKD